MTLVARLSDSAGLSLYSKYAHLPLAVIYTRLFAFAIYALLSISFRGLGQLTYSRLRVFDNVKGAFEGIEEVAANLEAN